MREKVLIIGALGKRAFCGPRVDISVGRSWIVDFDGDMKGNVSVFVDGHETVLFRDSIEISGKVANAEIREPGVPEIEMVTIRLRQVA